MITVKSSHILFGKSNWGFLFVLIYFLLVSGIPVKAQAPFKENLPSKGKTKETLGEFIQKNPWSNITGFRSAKFGMDEKSIYRAIAKDFKITKSKVKKHTNSDEKTTIYEILVPDLLSTGGSARVGYVMGYKSKKLIHINVVWGKGAVEKGDGQALVALGNLLRKHFLKKRYKQKGVAANQIISTNQTLLFRGKDQKDKMIQLVLNILKNKEEAVSTSDFFNNVQLRLSYVFNADEPDTFIASTKETDF